MEMTQLQKYITVAYTTPARALIGQKPIENMYRVSMEFKYKSISVSSSVIDSE